MAWAYNAGMTTPTPVRDQLNPRLQVLYDVLAERRHQDVKWGEQNHPHRRPEGLEAEYGLLGLAMDEGGPAELARHLCEQERKLMDQGQPGPSWPAIHLEEFCEVIEEAEGEEGASADRLHNMRIELIQLAATVVAQIEQVDREIKAEGV